ncbi:MAG: T9SS type A sorting domain-containing protein [Ginsengibacter sp.]
MRKIFYLIILLIGGGYINAQTIGSALKAGFGVDGDLRANYYNNFVQSGNDDWFNNATPGVGASVIDTTGAAAIVARYAIDPAFRKLPFYRGMKYPAYSVVNNKLLIDAIYIRDYHGEDSTIFASGASKNGESPATWTCPVAQSVPDKNEILDMMVHVRRAGSGSTDSLWMFGGLSIENTTGDRYFDFEMYQTDIYYDRPSQRFYGYGPDAGHTRWQFNASGDITVPGDIIFSADFGTSNLTSIEARIWVDKASLLITPLDFNWTGSFDGASNGSQYGYASISPKTSGNFYTGTVSINNTWAGPFSLVRGDNSVVTTYTANQFMEFSVNLTKLGLDPVTLLGGNACGMPFRRILVKSRASTSFTSALKDFVGPFDFFLAPRAKVQADQSVLCGLIAVSHIEVKNPVSTSVYTWSTTNGHIVGSSTGSSINVDSAGTYIVTQQLQSGCSVYATDTIVIFYNSSCFVLANNIIGFKAKLSNKQAQLNWTVSQNSQIAYFEIEKSIDGVHFILAAKVLASSVITPANKYSLADQLVETSSSHVYYRLKIINTEGNISYSKTLSFSFGEFSKSGISIVPNPVRDKMQLNITSLTDNKMQLFIYDIEGRLIKTLRTNISKGNSSLGISDFKEWPAGVYSLKVLLGDNLFTEKLVIAK